MRFVLFKNYGHMTPLRVLDWRETMNCMLTQAPGPGVKGANQVRPILVHEEEGAIVEKSPQE